MTFSDISINQWLFWLGCAVASYLLGSMPTGYLVVKQMTGQDIREHGSGSTGATNVRRLAGNAAAKIVMLIDILKSLVPIVLGQYVIAPQYPILHVLFGILAVVGHTRSIFLGFSGGKAAASSLGAVLALNPLAGAMTGILAFLVTKLSGYVSLGSISAAIMVNFFFIALGAPKVYIGFVLICSSYVVILHRENIQRLFKGTENRLQ